MRERGDERCEETRHNRSPQPNLVKIGLGWVSEWVLFWVGGEVGLGWLELVHFYITKE